MNARRGRASGRPVPGRGSDGPEALTVERPVEARQEQFRALPGPPGQRRVGQWPDRLSYKEDAGGSTPPSSTVTEVEVVETPGCGPGRSRFESGRSPSRCGGFGDQRGLIRPVRGFDPRPRHPGLEARSEAQLPCNEKVPAPIHPADVAQPGEARRSDRRKCRFESDRQYAGRLHVAQWERAGFGSRGLGVRVSPSRPMGGSTWSHLAPLRSNPGLAVIRRCNCRCRAL